MKCGNIKNQIIEDIRIYEGISSMFENNNVQLYTSYGVIDDEMTFEAAGVNNADKIMII